MNYVLLQKPLRKMNILQFYTKHWQKNIRLFFLDHPIWNVVLFICLFNRSGHADTHMGPDGTRLMQWPQAGMMKYILLKLFKTLEKMNILQFDRSMDTKISGYLFLDHRNAIWRNIKYILLKSFKTLEKMNILQFDRSMDTKYQVNFSGPYRMRYEGIYFT